MQNFVFIRFLPISFRTEQSNLEGWANMRVLLFFPEGWLVIGGALTSSPTALSSPRTTPSKQPRFVSQRRPKLLLGRGGGCNTWGQCSYYWGPTGARRRFPTFFLPHWSNLNKTVLLYTVSLCFPPLHLCQWGHVFFSERLFALSSKKLII